MRKTLLLTSTLAALAAVSLFSQQPSELPAGPAKATVEASCQKCHALDQIVRSGHDPQEWKLTVERMISVGAEVPEAQLAPLVQYLTTNFPDRSPVAKIIGGTIKVNFKEWTVPTKGSRPHDPLAAHDGSLWYTGQFASKLGHVDTRTGEFDEYSTKTPRSGPHGLVEDKDGNIWYTGNFVGIIGKLNPKTREFTEYKLAPEARDPHTPIFDQKGILWFSAQSANLIGRLDPKTGDVKLAKMPVARSNPYGVVVTSKGVPVFVEFGGPRIAAIDPSTMAIKEYALPNPDSRPRRIAIDENDIVWYADYSRGYLGRLDLVTGKVTEYASPSGPRSQPYGISIRKGEVWYNESGVKPNALVRFIPKTEKFESWAVPAGGGVVRNMMTTIDGKNNLVIAESALNMVALVEIQ